MWCLKLQSIVLFLHNLTLTCSKSSLLVQFLFFFSSGKTAKACWCGLVLNFSNGIMQAVWTILLCRPFFLWWTWGPQMLLDGKHEVKCGPDYSYYWSSMIVNIITSIVVFIIPLPKIWKLPLPPKAKVGLFLVFGIGVM